MQLAKFMASGAGRGLRIVVGAGLVWWGLGLNSTGGSIAIAIGVVAILAGVLNFCLIGPVIGAPFWGKDAK